jgi:hypothetical protein
LLLLAAPLHAAAPVTLTESERFSAASLTSQGWGGRLAVTDSGALAIMAEGPSGHEVATGCDRTMAGWSCSFVDQGAMPPAVGAGGADRVATFRGFDDNHVKLSRDGAAFSIVISSHPFDWAEAVDVDGDVIAIGIPTNNGGDGEVQIWRRAGSTWIKDQTLLGSSSDDGLGAALALDHPYLVVGAPNGGTDGVVRIYTDLGFTFAPMQTISPNFFDVDVGFASSLDVHGEWLAVGAPLLDIGTINGTPDVGAVLLYRLSAGTFGVQQTVRPADAAEDDHFGAAVALRAATLVAGSPGADTGILHDTGRAYVFWRSGVGWEERFRLQASNFDEFDLLGTAVAVGDLGAFTGGPDLDEPSYPNAGAVLVYLGIAILAHDGFESGDLAGWSGAAP